MKVNEKDDIPYIMEKNVPNHKPHKYIYYNAIGYQLGMTFTTHLW